jgi:hypothetical protein
MGNGGSLMPGARSVLPKHRTIKFRRGGSPSKAEKEHIAQFVLDQPTEITPRQVTALATSMRRSKEVIKSMIEQAKDNFQAGAERYVEIHKQAIEAALANGDSKSLHVATQGAQWAMENLSAEGVSIVGKRSEGGSGAGKIMIGIQIGGIRGQDSATVIDAEKLP